ncbi:ribonucleoside-diphosphate reductase 2 alpha chain [Escherichia coli]|uniref:Ribonucleoside-diphosphate reductase 2 alpha chain n=1 Tax=Escherichia coli TaxID=562 RepID=A0A377K1T4_ECOLX|nr:ribonucleoside-diphosphate reductase 2 alpha chain [Escherichia coli]
MTNENLALYQDAYEIGAEKIIDTYAEATRHVDQGLSLTLFFPRYRHHSRYQQSADLRLAQGYQNALLHSPASDGAGRH